MRFGSVCSGIEAASVAWEPLGWQAAWFAEIEPFPSAVLAHHYPNTPNLGDMTDIPALLALGEVEAPDILCGGTPCQAFSVAGLRRSLDDARGNLSLIFCEITNAIDDQRRAAGAEPCIVFWENVPGVLSTKDNAFGCFLAGLAGEDVPLEPPGGKWSDAGVVLGPARAVAWRTLDAQFFGLAQRRRRVFVVASAREGFDPAQVLLEFEGVRRDSAPSREAGKGVARGAAPSFGIRSANTKANGWGIQRELTHTLDTASPQIVAQAFGGNRTSGSIDITPALLAQPGSGWKGDFETETFVAHTLRGEGFDASEDGTGRGTPLVPVTFRADAMREGTAKTPSPDAEGRVRLRDPGMGMYEDIAPTLDCGAAHGVAHAFDARQSDVIQYGDKTGLLDTDGHSVGVLAFSSKDHGADSHANGGGQMAVAFASATEFLPQSSRVYSETEASPTLQATGARHGNRAPHVHAAMQVRRLTPRECERLQGFPDDYTAIPWRGKPASECPDGPRYKALGNSWAVPVVRWIGARIECLANIV